MAEKGKVGENISGVVVIVCIAWKAVLDLNCCDDIHSVRSLRVERSAREVETWLILPVVMCLSERFIYMAKLRMAH